jgi:hypothetical protein
VLTTDDCSCCETGVLFEVFGRHEGDFEVVLNQDTAYKRGIVVPSVSLFGFTVFF